MENPTTELLSGIYKLSQTGIEAVESVIPKAEPEGLKKELLSQYSDYKDASAASEQGLLARGYEPKDLNPLQKAVMWGSIQLHTLKDSSADSIADMMITGTTKGIVDLTKHINTCQNAEKSVIDFAEGFVAAEQKHIDRLKEFL